MPNPGQELSSIDFASMLGGPLLAVVNAQAQAAMSRVNFIKEVGFKKPAAEEAAGGDTSTMEPIYVTFKYPKSWPYQPRVAAIPAVPAGPTDQYGATNPAAVPSVPEVAAVPAVYETQKLQVPILTMLPIPFIRIDLTTIDFNAKINSVEYQKTDTNLKIDAALEAKAGWLWGSAKLNVATPFQRTTPQGNTVDRTYSMVVHIKAVQDEIPAGMEGCWASRGRDYLSPAYRQARRAEEGEPHALSGRLPGSASVRALDRSDAGRFRDGSVGGTVRGAPAPSDDARATFQIPGGRPGHSGVDQGFRRAPRRRIGAGRGNGPRDEPKVRQSASQSSVQG